MRIQLAQDLSRVYPELREEFEMTNHLSSELVVISILCRDSG